MAKFCLVLFGMVEIFDSVMRARTGVPELAIIEIVAQGTDIAAQGSTAVLHVCLVIEKTTFRVVRLGEVAGFGLEAKQIKHFYSLLPCILILKLGLR